jgi:hypothetical protein
LKPAVRKAPDPRLENRRCNEHNPYEIRISAIIKLDEEKNCIRKYIDMEIGNREKNIYIM